MGTVCYHPLRSLTIYLRPLESSSDASDKVLAHISLKSNDISESPCLAYDVIQVSRSYEDGEEFTCILSQSFVLMYSFLQMVTTTDMIDYLF